MLGYKGIEVDSGILRSKSMGTKLGDIFEIGVPKERVNVCDDGGFTENGYSFCSDMAYVLSWENYLYNHDERYTGVASRLFLVDTLDGEVLGGKSHYKSNTIKIVREVSRDEIVDFFTKNPDRLTEKFKADYEDFCDRPWSPYHELKDKNEIEKYVMGKCPKRTQASLCKQVNDAEDISLCNSCAGYTMGRWDEFIVPNLLYLQARRKLKSGDNLSDIDEYKLLSERGMDIELRALENLDRYLHS